MSARCLSIHATYGCRHSGACCSQWTVPAEAHVVEFVRTAGLRTGGTTGPLFIQGRDADTAARIARRDGGTCVFREDHRCSIHSTGGAASLPAACRHYPRVALQDGRGVLISLSHYCPTAAAMLFDGGRPRIVAAPESLVIADPIEGLDAREALPPLLRPDMLMDLDGYGAWESAAVRVFAQAGDAAQALAVVADATEGVRRWAPSARSLRDAVLDSFETAAPNGAASGWDNGAAGVLASTLAPGFPVVRRERSVPLPPALERGILNYLAARTFGNWIAYQGRGLRTVVAWLHACHDVVRALVADEGAPTRETVIQAVRATDLLMLHTIDSQAFADAAVAGERSRS